MTHTRKPAVDRRLKELMPTADDGTPRYVQLARKLASAIQAGVWKPNEVLPAERELCEQLSVSRVTLRQALDAVAEQGLRDLRLRFDHGVGESWSGQSGHRGHGIGRRNVSRETTGG